jgi:integrase
MALRHQPRSTGRGGAHAANPREIGGLPATTDSRWVPSAVVPSRRTLVRIDGCRGRKSSVSEDLFGLLVLCRGDAGDRIIPIGPTTVATLTEYLEMRQRWQQVSGDTWPRTGFFFVRPDGQPWHPQIVSDRFDYLVRASGLPPVRLHDLRHCAATYLRHGGADMKEIQEVLGHSTIGLTSDTYTSVILELRRPNADAAASLIPRKEAAW